MTSNFIFFNPNPNQRYKKDGTPMHWNGTDCTVRSLAKAMNWPWIQTYKYLTAIGEELLMTYDDITVLAKAYERLGFQKMSLPRTGQKPTINQFTKEHKTGTYIISINGHVVCVEGGKIYDTWDCGEWKVRSYYIKTK